VVVLVVNATVVVHVHVRTVAAGHAGALGTTTCWVGKDGRGRRVEEPCVVVASGGVAAAAAVVVADGVVVVGVVVAAVVDNHHARGADHDSRNSHADDSLDSLHYQCQRIRHAR
jgi:hypothetical protein